MVTWEGGFRALDAATLSHMLSSPLPLPSHLSGARKQQQQQQQQQQQSSRLCAPFSPASMPLARRSVCCTARWPARAPRCPLRALTLRQLHACTAATRSTQKMLGRPGTTASSERHPKSIARYQCLSASRFAASRARPHPSQGLQATCDSARHVQIATIPDPRTSPSWQDTAWPCEYLKGGPCEQPACVWYMFVLPATTSCISASPSRPKNT